MTSSSFVRRLVSMAMMVVFALSLFVTARGADSNRACPMPQPSCHAVMITDCCAGQQPAPATPVELATAWSRVLKVHAQLISWPAGKAGECLIVIPVLVQPALVASPPAPDRHLLSVLLI